MSDVIFSVPCNRRLFCKVTLTTGLLFSKPVWAASPTRLISIGGALTEMIYALGAHHQLVGVDTTSLYPKAAQALPSVGYARTLSAEGILSLAPNLIVATEDAGPPAVLRQLTQARIPLEILVSHYRFEGIIDRIKRLGRLLGRETQAATLAQTVTTQWQQTQRVVKPIEKQRPKVLFILSPTSNQIMVSGQNTGAEAMLRYAGAQNAMAGFSGYKPLTPESVIAAQPEVILLTEQGLRAAGGKEAILRLPGLSQTPAGKNGRIIELETMWLLGFGPRFPSAVQRLHANLQSVLK